MSDDNRILDAEEFKDALRVLAKWRGEGGHDMADAWDAATAHDEALRAALATAETERNALAADYGQMQEWYTAYRRKSEARVAALEAALRDLCDAHPLTHGPAVTAARALLVGEPADE